MLKICHFITLMSFFGQHLVLLCGNWLFQTILWGLRLHAVSCSQLLGSVYHGFEVEKTAGKKTWKTRCVYGNLVKAFWWKTAMSGSAGVASRGGNFDFTLTKVLPCRESWRIYVDLQPFLWVQASVWQSVLNRAPFFFCELVGSDAMQTAGEFLFCEM